MHKLADRLSLIPIVLLNNLWTAVVMKTASFSLTKSIGLLVTLLWGTRSRYCWMFGDIWYFMVCSSLASERFLICKFFHIFEGSLFNALT